MTLPQDQGTTSLMLQACFRACSEELKENLSGVSMGQGGYVLSKSDNEFIVTDASGMKLTLYENQPFVSIREADLQNSDDDRNMRNVFARFEQQFTSKPKSLRISSMGDGEYRVQGEREEMIIGEDDAAYACVQAYMALHRDQLYCEDGSVLHAKHSAGLCDTFQNLMQAHGESFKPEQRPYLQVRQAGGKVFIDYRKEIDNSQLVSSRRRRHTSAVQPVALSRSSVGTSTGVSNRSRALSDSVEAGVFTLDEPTSAQPLQRPGSLAH
jgi:hypothetical protein